MCGIDHYGPEKPVGNHSGTGLRKAVTYHCQPSPKAQESGLRDTEWTDEERVDFANAFEEIEHVLSGCPEMQEVVVIVREDHPGEKQLVVYYTGTDTPEALRGYLQAKLPGQMASVVFIQIAALPIKPNGKVDLKALPLPERQRTEGALHASTHESRKAGESYEALANSLSFGVEHK